MKAERGDGGQSPEVGTERGRAQHTKVDMREWPAGLWTRTMGTDQVRGHLAAGLLGTLHGVLEGRPVRQKSREGGDGMNMSGEGEDSGSGHVGVCGLCYGVWISFQL